MKKLINKNSLAVIYILGGILIFIPNILLAADEAKNTLMALDKVFDAIGGEAKSLSNGTVDLPTFFNVIFKTAISFALVFTVIRIFQGGFIYATTESIFNKGEAKKIIMGALYGLGLILISWLILNTIDPNLVSLKFLSGTSNEQTDYNYDYDYDYNQ